MTDRVNGLIVTLKNDIRDDDIQAWIKSISMIKGVVSVVPNIADVGEYIARERVRQEFKSKLYELYKSL